MTSVYAEACVRADIVYNLLLKYSLNHYNFWLYFKITLPGSPCFPPYETAFACRCVSLLLMWKEKVQSQIQTCRKCLILHCICIQISRFFDAILIVISYYHHPVAITNNNSNKIMRRVRQILCYGWWKNSKELYLFTRVAWPSCNLPDALCRTSQSLRKV